MSIFLTNSQVPLLSSNNNISASTSAYNSIISNTINNTNSRWKSWSKSIASFSVSTVISTVITSPIIAITDYWKETTKLSLINGWTRFIINPAMFISNELINSFFNTLTFLKLEFFFDTIVDNSLSTTKKLKKCSKNAVLIMMILLINDIGSTIISNQFTKQNIWYELSKNFMFNFFKEIGIVIAWKTFKCCLTENNSVNDYVNAMIIMVLLAVCYVDINALQTLYQHYVKTIPISEFMLNFIPIVVSNTVTGGLRIVSSSLLTYFFNDIVKRWNSSSYQQLSDHEHEVLSTSNTINNSRSYTTFDSNNLRLPVIKRSISNDSFFNAKAINKFSEQSSYSLNDIPQVLVLS